MKRETFDTRIRPGSDRTGYWERATRRFFGPLGTSNLAEREFDARMLVYSVGPLRLYTIDATAHRVIRDHPELGEATDSYKLLLQLRGTSEIEQHNARVTLDAGDWSLYDPRVPYSITSRESLAHMVVQIPRERLRKLSLPALHASVPSQPGLEGLYSVLSRFLCSLSNQLDTLPAASGAALGEATLALLESTLQAQKPDVGGPRPLPEALRLRVREYIDSNLADSELTIERIARDLKCSKRYLHRVFEREETTVERYIWNTRLARCRQAFERGAHARTSISEVAWRWGFSSTAHFSRRFKARYGVTPTQFVNAIRC